MSYFNSINFDPSNESAFGSLETVELTPVIQGDFVYGTNTQIWSSGSYGGTSGSVDTNSGRLRVQSGTDANGFAFITSRRPIRYRAGQGTVARFTPLFTSGSANNIQLWGMGTTSSTNPYDGYFFGYNGASFGIARYSSGVATWTSQGNWNGDKCDGSAGASFTYQPDKGTPAMIKYPYLGFGNIEFFLQNPTTGHWVLCHTIQYANTTNVTQVSNPTLQFMGFTKNSGNTANKIMYCGSVGVFISGVRTFVGNPKWAIDNNKASITTETNIFTLKNATNYNGLTNRGLIRLNCVSFGSQAASGVATLRLRLNATTGGAQSFTTINGNTVDNGVSVTTGNSIASYDTAGTTISTAGTLIFNITVANNSGGAFIDMIPFDVFIAPGETMTFSISSTITSTVTAAVNWTEDI